MCSVSTALKFRQSAEELLLSSFEAFLLLELPFLLGVQLPEVLCCMGQDGHFRGLGRLQTRDLIPQGQETGPQVVPPLSLKEIVVPSAVSVLSVRV